jgi:hypothetical protein
MGDRSNIKIYQNDDADNAIFLYTHWRGSEIYGILKRVLLRRERWEDSPYLTRMIFCEMVKGDENGSTGFGISTSILDNEHTVIGVNCVDQEITFEDGDGNIKSSISFEQFVTRKDKFSPAT